MADPRRQWRAAFFVGGLVTLLACGATAETLTIGAWNIERLGEPKYEKDGADLADYVAASGARVVALEEIAITHLDANGLRRNHVLDATVAALGHTWRYVLFGTSCTGRRQNLGVLFDRAVVRPRMYLKLPVPTNEYHPHQHRGGVKRHRILCRAPVAIWFQAHEGKTDFLLIPVHLKANEPREPHPEQIVDHRKVEAEHIVRALAKMLPKVGEGTERDVYIGGDTNVLDHDDPDMRAFLKGGFVDLNAMDTPTYVAGTAPFDRFLVARDSVEVRRRSFSVHKAYVAKRGLTPAEFEKRYSDHHMVTFEIELTADDD
jgi:hypothetical protein